MKTRFKFLNLTLLATGLLATVAAGAATPTRYTLTITNGSAMPLSPGVVYVKDGQSPAAKVGDAPANGFVRLCQMGNPMDRAMELRANMEVKSVAKTTSPILPGESRMLEIEVPDPLQQSVHFETMYGKTKDLCALGSVGSHSLYALKQHVTSEVLTKDNVLATGAFLDPALPMGRTYLDTDICMNAMDAVSCLRELALPNPGMAKIHFFSSYLSSLTMLLEMKYGAAQTQALLLSPAGAVQLQLKLKH